MTINFERDLLIAASLVVGYSMTVLLISCALPHQATSASQILGGITAIFSFSFRGCRMRERVFCRDSDSMSILKLPSLSRLVSKGGVKRSMNYFRS